MKIFNVTGTMSGSGGPLKAVSFNYTSNRSGTGYTCTVSNNIATIRLNGGAIIIETATNSSVYGTTDQCWVCGYGYLPYDGYSGYFTNNYDNVSSTHTGDIPFTISSDRKTVQVDFSEESYCPYITILYEA